MRADNRWSDNQTSRLGRSASYETGMFPMVRPGKFGFTGLTDSGELKVPLNLPIPHIQTGYIYIVYTNTGTNVSVFFQSDLGNGY